MDFSALQRRIVSPARCQTYASAQPANFMAFDVLFDESEDLRSHPLRGRRDRLERRLSGVTPPIQLVPQTTDRALAERWLADYTAADVGVEGLVVKPLAGRYQPGRRGWTKVKARHTSEALVGAVTGDLAQPRHLVLGRLTTEGRLRVVGATTVLSVAHRADVAEVLRPPVGIHPWPARLPGGWTGSFSRESVELTLVEPFVVEVLADLAVDAHRWRHPVRFLRHRPDLGARDLPVLPQLPGHRRSA